MKNVSKAVAVTIAMAGMSITTGASAMPGFSEEAPMDSVKACVAEVAGEANYLGAARVRHEVSSKERLTGGHTISIDTTVFGDDGERVIREYASFCAVDDSAQTKRFKIREKGV